MIFNAVVLLADICSATMCNHGSVACFNAELSSSSMGEYILGNKRMGWPPAKQVPNKVTEVSSNDYH